MLKRSPRQFPALAAVLSLLVTFGVADAARGADEHHTLWVARGAHNSVVLLGSVHMLKPGASELPPEAAQAYAHAKALVMEVDLNALNAEDLLTAMSNQSAMAEDQTLAEALGPALYDRFRKQARVLGLDADMLAHTQPWLAALALDQAQMAKLGYASAAGVDEQLAHQAAADHKPIVGLETVEEQLGVFARLSAAQQRRFLAYTLDEEERAGDELEHMVSAWRRGDTVALEQLLQEGFEDFPDLLAVLTTERNRRWLATLLPLLAENQDYLVVVGAMHLVGKNGLVELLRQRGYSVTQH